MTWRPEIAIPPGLARTVDQLGEKAARWLNQVPALAARTAQAWELEIEGSLEHEGSASVVLAVTTPDDLPAVLKLSLPSDDSRQEAEALARWDGDGAVQLYRRSEDGFVLLLERCDPGSPLWHCPPDEQIAVIVDLLPRLWSTAIADGHPFRELATTAARWERQMTAGTDVVHLPAAVVTRARRWARELVADQPRRLLHGDLHPGNILASVRAPWLAIDAKPWVGDPAFDLAQVLINWVTGGPPATSGHTHPQLASEEVVDRASRLAEALDLDRDRMLWWAVVKAIGWSFDRAGILVLDDAARDA